MGPERKGYAARGQRLATAWMNGGMGMKRLLFLAGLCLLAAAAMAPSVAGARATSQSASVARLPSAPANVKASRHLTARYDWRAPNHVSTSAALRQSKRATTIQMWHRAQGAGGVTYSYSMVGRNPYVAQTSQTSIKTYLVSVNIVNGVDAFSPFVSDECDVSGTSPKTRLLNSPIFKNRTYSWGSPTATQITDAFQRAEFRKFTQPSGLNPNYHVELGLAATHNVTVHTHGWPEVSGDCGNLLELDINAWDSFAQSEIAALGLGPTDFVLFQVHDVVFTDGGSCCILGYHSAFGSPVQTYGTADYDTTGLFSDAPDIAATTHEVGEWMDDPLGNNPTPSWGNIGQVVGCQANLEVGDPLSGTTFPITMNSFTYHPQELAFFSWFYHQSPSIGISGWYSDRGTFRTFAAPC
jgi:hypothetical protein